MRSPMRLQDLPNELLIEIFTYLDARRLYRSFHNLNYRLNSLLQSLGQLRLVVGSLDDEDYDHLFASRVRTLVVHFDAAYILSRYVNLRHLVLFHAKHDQISQMMMDGSHLETISLISPRCFYTTFGFHEMIFSNQFPSLKSCYLTNVYSPSVELRQLSWSQAPLLRSLRISSHDSLVHVAILNACPNLCFLNLSVFHLDHTPSDVKPHQALKKVQFTMNNPLWPSDPTVFDTFFASMPYIQRLTVQRSAVLPDVVDELLQFDWFSGVLLRQLTFLKQFIFYLHLMNANQMDGLALEKFLGQIEKRFVHSFQNCRHYRLLVKRV